MRKPLAIAIVSMSVAVCSPAAAAQDHPAAPQPILSDTAPQFDYRCKNDNPAEVVVCGKSRQPYRIDPNVLAASRAVEAAPPKPALDASEADGCVGPNCGGGVIPLVGMALAAIKAAALAAEGDDWRDALRTHPDEYQAYRQSKAATKGGISFGVSAGNK